MREFYKVLIVDDEMLIRQGIINYIEWENEGYKIIGEASNGVEAMQLMETHHPHIIITDIVMPGMDGIELVKNVKDSYPETEIIVLSSFENFDYVKQTFQNGVADYILKPKLQTDELLQTLNRVTKSQKKTTQSKESQPSIEEILQKIIAGYQSIREMDYAREQLSKDTFILIESFWNKRTDQQLSHHIITNQLENRLSNAILRSVPFKENSALYLVNFSEMSINELKEAVYNSSKNISANQLKWVISNPFDSLEDLKTNYEITHKKIIQYHFYLPEVNFLFYDNLPESEIVNTEFDLNHMIYLFKRKQFQEAFIYLNKHIGLLSNQYNTDVFEFQSWLENIIFNIIVLLGNMNYGIEELEKEKYQYFQEINEAFNVREAISTFDQFLSKVEQKVLPENAEAMSNIQLLLDYIEENYDNHLTLSTLARHFHFNPSYLSSYFSKHHKEGFSDYLNYIRIKNAMQLLESTDKSISSISEAVGYSDPSYFTKVFKKVTNTSPSTYRKENKRQN
ncbi:response regulator transcription factor [Gracilibacillus massiliensis]|uniref:response regulator transcription factor n=1 Tax=Gracilibacillus massiliensis TaxID=1564956 RepID=UPI00071DA2F9|nr:response regulator transcription factor [Gracilibacillus massiliensis]